MISHPFPQFPHLKNLWESSIPRDKTAGPLEACHPSRHGSSHPNSAALRVGSGQNKENRARLPNLFGWTKSGWVLSLLYGYGSIPINTIFRGMNIHLPAILMFTRGTRFWHTAILIWLIIQIMWLVCRDHAMRWSNLISDLKYSEILSNMMIAWIGGPIFFGNLKISQHLPFL